MMKTILDSLKSKKIICIGDVILDRFVYGDVTRVSPEAPVPVLNVTHQREMPGGVGNVVRNLNDLGCEVIVFAVTGEDENRRVLDAMFKETKRVTAHLMADSGRPTIVKERFATDSQHIMRADREKTHAISSGIETAILDRFAGAVASADAVILSDYNKGTLTDNLIRSVMSAATEHDVPVFADPKGSDYSRYQGAYTLTPNLKEIIRAGNNGDFAAAARAVMQQAGLRSLVVTMAEDGVAVFEAGTKEIVRHKGAARIVRDVSGAGDTFIAGLAAAVSTGAPLAEAAFFANRVAGLSVEKQGTATVTHGELDTHFSSHLAPRPTFAPVLGRSEAKKTVERWKAEGLIVGFTNGCFDILHQGHAVYLDKARQHCDRLVLGLNVDASITRLKGAGRPVNPLQARASVIAALGSIDLVVPFGDEAEENDTPVKLVSALLPDILFKGADYTVDQLPEAVPVINNGGKVILVELEDGFSTTNTIKKLSAA